MSDEKCGKLYDPSMVKHYHYRHIQCDIVLHVNLKRVLSSSAAYVLYFNAVYFVICMAVFNVLIAISKMLVAMYKYLFTYYYVIV